ncbi:hypothetical protein [Lysobacter sp. CA196]|uniref:hypothetical protein n=1 Tax=Lysobacter sp. CA196 TaxID=3455606 RepID=UPI003F8D62AE
MADTGANGRKGHGAADLAPASATPCCGLPSPLASAIRSTVRIPAHAGASAPTAAPPTVQREDGESGPASIR